jgi:hypothetical protein
MQSCDYSARSFVQNSKFNFSTFLVLTALLQTIVLLAVN